jgi:hypothetical protein
MSKKNFLRLMLIVVLLSGFWAMVQAARLEVTTTQDNVPGSLRAAITTANSNNEDDSIYLPPGTYILGGQPDEDANAGGDLDVDTGNCINIIGSNAETTIIDGNRSDRVIHILNGRVSISGVTVQNGRTVPVTEFWVPNQDGGGIYNTATLTLMDCVVSNNSIGSSGNLNDRGDGGGIYNSGILTISGCTVENNIAGYAVNAVYNLGPGGYGGGIYNSGTLTVTNSRICNNKAGDTSDSRDGGDPGDGGGIYNSEAGEAALTNCIVSGNSTYDGKGFARYGGSGGDGGGIFSEGKLTLTNCTISGNTTGSGGGGGGDGMGGPGWGGPGAGIYNTGEKQATLTNCTISNNSTGKGGDSDFEYFGGGSGGSGGGIFNDSTITLVSCTICNNSTGEAGEDGERNEFEPAAGGFGGGIGNSGGTVKIQNTIVANNQVAFAGEGPDCSGTFNSHKYNLVENTENCTMTGDLTGNITGIDPLLGPLADNGGPGHTHALLPGSPAVDAGYGFGTFFDQRGCTRPMDISGIANANDGTDIGAFEYNSTPGPYILLNRKQLTFHGNTSGLTSGPQEFSISNSGGGTLNWSISYESGWLNCTPMSGSHQGIVTVSVNVQGITAGTYIDTITISSPNAFNSPQSVSVILNIDGTGQTTEPFGVFATPINGSTVRSSVPVTGWVLDDIGLQSLQLFREDGNSLEYIGDAVFVEGARPDVEETYPGYPNNYKAGWGYMLLTNFLPNGGNGTYKIRAIAADMEGNQVSLGTKTIICDNANAVKPFGAIDTPAQGGTAPGIDYVNFGWALTPLPNRIPTNGTTIKVWVDGVLLGHPVYNRYRKDIATLFPGYNNSAGAGGHFYLDTTQYKNGVHTIQWTVTDDAGNTDGIGSRYFTIQNPGNTASGEAQSAWRTAYSVPGRTPGILQIPIDYSHPVKVIKGYNQYIEPGIIYPDDRGDITIEIKELQRIEVWLSEGTRGLASLSNSSESSTSVPGGFQLMGDRLATLPIGSFLDSKNGIFSWVPGPGFLGDYKFAFIDKSKTGEMKQRLITVRIRPQFE